jgi:hypothetical protein
MKAADGKDDGDLKSADTMILFFWPIRASSANRFLSCRCRPPSHARLRPGARGEVCSHAISDPRITALAIASFTDFRESVAFKFQERLAGAVGDDFIRSLRATGVNAALVPAATKKRLRAGLGR